MLSIDILASRIAVGNHRYEVSSRSRNQQQKSAGLHTHSHRERNDFEMFGTVKSQVYVRDGASSSQEHIVNPSSISTHVESGEYSQSTTEQIDGINKTVEFKVHESAA